jgi:transposase
VPMLAELIDAVVGVDTHRDTHEVEIALPTGTAIGTRKISNDNSGFAELLAWIVDNAPGPRVVVSIEGTRSFGVGLARAVAAAGLTVIECEQPNRKARRGKGKSDPIDAHLAVLAALRLDADRLPIPRADGDREALRILLGTRHELTVVTTAQTNRLRALLLGGGDTERDLARATLTDPVLLAMVRRREPSQASREQAVRHGEIRRLAHALRGGASRVSGQPGSAADHRGPDRSRVDRAPRHRRGHRSSSHRVFLPPRTVPKRRRIRRAVGHQSTAGQQRQDSPASAQPRRRPGPEQRNPHHRCDPHAVLPHDQGLRRPSHGRGQVQP